MTILKVGDAMPCGCDTIHARVQRKHPDGSMELFKTCFELNTVTGVARVYELDADGNIKVNATRTDTVKGSRDGALLFCDVHGGPLT